MEKLKKRSGKVVAEEEQLRLEAKSESEDSESLIKDEFSVLCRDLYALYPLLIRYVDNNRYNLKGEAKTFRQVEGRNVNCTFMNILCYVKVSN